MQEEYEDLTDDALPVMFEHCCTVYKAMSQTAKQKGNQLIWDGFLTRLVNDQLRMSTPYYSTIRNNLLRMECIHQLRRGGSNTTSQWLLQRAPTRELWEKMPEVSLTSKPSQTAVLTQRVDELTDRVAFLEKAFRLGLEVSTEDMNEAS